MLFARGAQGSWGLSWGTLVVKGRKEENAHDHRTNSRVKSSAQYKHAVPLLQIIIIVSDQHHPHRDN